MGGYRYVKQISGWTDKQTLVSSLQYETIHMVHEND